MIYRSSDEECAGSVMVIEFMSPKTVEASSKETECLDKFIRALLPSHSKCNPTAQIYRSEVLVPSLATSYANCSSRRACCAEASESGRGPGFSLVLRAASRSKGERDSGNSTRPQSAQTGRFSLRANA